MNDLISREATLEYIKSVFCKGCNDYGGIRCRACEIADVMSVIDDNVRAVDAEPVRHGRWINKSYITTAYGSIETGDCSACGAVDVPIEPYDNYCPGCGAKMDREDTK